MLGNKEQMWYTVPNTLVGNVIDVNNFARFSCPMFNQELMDNREHFGSVYFCVFLAQRTESGKLQLLLTRNASKKNQTALHTSPIEFKGALVTIPLADIMFDFFDGYKVTCSTIEPIDLKSYSKVCRAVTKDDTIWYHPHIAVLDHSLDLTLMEDYELLRYDTVADFIADGGLNGSEELTPFISAPGFAEFFSSLHQVNDDVV